MTNEKDSFGKKEKHIPVWGKAFLRHAAVVSGV